MIVVICVAAWMAAIVVAAFVLTNRKLRAEDMPLTLSKAGPLGQHVNSWEQDSYLDYFIDTRDPRYREAEGQLLDISLEATGPVQRVILEGRVAPSSRTSPTSTMSKSPSHERQAA